MRWMSVTGAYLVNKRKQEYSVFIIAIGKMSTGAKLDYVLVITWSSVAYIDESPDPSLVCSLECIGDAWLAFCIRYTRIPRTYLKSPVGAVRETMDHYSRVRKRQLVRRKNN